MNFLHVGDMHKSIRLYSKSSRDPIQGFNPLFSTTIFPGELRCGIPDYWSLEDFRVVKGMYPVINSGQSVLIECLKPSRWESGRMELNCNDGILAPDFICGSR